ncbi:dihydroorotase [Clostridium tepidiprofundi DSM 19306]|uniref:Dihydroorotase n=1 Tax=Clostridium tepidiprofundi DSM 19306 TaxID=1121338 RepID=A0A151AVA5_9CLOT|nr:dihydroorotase [Clostridium tepidiprofundi]KYH31480.1 dihydroorotase [Clostridium tepidiprofundi DSM 19306]
MEILIKKARIVDAFNDFSADIYIKDGIISEIGCNINKDCIYIDASEKVILPSLIEMHCHFRDPGYTYKEDILTGSMAAVKGGYTAVNLMANTKPVCSSMDIVDYVLNKAREINLIDINQVVSITENSDGKSIKHLDKIDSKVKFISDDGKGVCDDKIMYDAMIKANEKDLTIISHAEAQELSEIDMRLAENVMTARDIALSEITNCKLHMAHVSTKEAINYIIEAKKRGVNVTCEVTPHHIALNDKTEYRVNPPLRNEEDVNALIDAIKDGWVDVIATDHAPHTNEDKLNGSPGISGIETAFSVCYTKLVKENSISLSELSKLMSLNPARMMGLNKGRIQIGYDGDLILVDLKKKYKIETKNFKSKGKNTPFEGKEVYGEIVATIRKGRIVYQNGEVIIDDYR